MEYVIIVLAVASNLALRVDIYGETSLVRAGASAWRVERDEVPVRSTQKAVVNVIAVLIFARDHSLEVNAVCNRALA